MIATNSKRLYKGVKATVIAKSLYTDITITVFNPIDKSLTPLPFVNKSTDKTLLEIDTPTIDSYLLLNLDSILEVYKVGYPYYLVVASKEDSVPYKFIDMDGLLIQEGNLDPINQYFYGKSLPLENLFVELFSKMFYIKREIEPSGAIMEYDFTSADITLPTVTLNDYTLSSSSLPDVTLDSFTIDVTLPDVTLPDVTYTIS